ncbi:low molecular weight phosphatase family protein [Halodesulfurarchaeum sp. HSR-GB]|uniref:arsenate reductase/protein-tyrosine-phosphatase family protein n=1 Tax=Halodesulfurarchaeum sp. HSR-GB TaxID=3074077 RepID=UPI0028636DF9|nr:low molecular weight phosphatase family protein [Halodesulfurarchaeum sp. HSR-GB]MDR5655986.1 low molecular weight phosphatase family protein [Halodesulfurarchaeum sp. HSR-GB]
MSEPTRIAFVCVENAGRSQMAAAFARRAVAESGLDGIEIHSGGTDPAAAVHDVVIEAMAETGIDISENRPRKLPRETVMAMDYVITMGCSAEDVCPATWRGDSRDWGLPDPGGQPLDVVREIRDEIAERVESLLEAVRTGDKPTAGEIEPEF